MENFTSIRLTGRHVSAGRYRVEEKENICVFPRGDREISFPVLEFRNNATWALVKAAHDEESYGLLLRDPYAEGRIYSLTVPDAYPDFYRIHGTALSRIRQEFPVRGVWLEGPARISLFVYDNDTVILYPYVMEGVQRERIRLHVRGAAALRAQPENREILPLYEKEGEAVFDLIAMPGRYTLYQILFAASGGPEEK